jgi:beta-hydroxylase
MRALLANDSTSHVQQAKARRPLIVRWGKKVRKPLNRLLSRYSLVPLDPILSIKHFAWLENLQKAWPVIRQEVDELLPHLSAIPPMNEMSPDHGRIAADGGWRSYFLVGYGYRLKANCARCPKTTKALEQVPGLVTALFSILEPGMHVGRHRGVSKGILIAHLGLRVPGDASSCRMEVEDQQIHWQEGETFVFDDTYPHEVWNDTNEHRVILLIQFERPMRRIGQLITRLLVAAVRASPYIQDAKRNLNFWEWRLKQAQSLSHAS